MFALQHRGQESAGIASSSGDAIVLKKDLGLVAQVFDEWALAALKGDLAIGHTRYSTMGSTRWENAQPTFRRLDSAQFALGHNGNLTNTSELAVELGTQLASTDTDLMAEAIVEAYTAAEGKGGIAAAVAASVARRSLAPATSFMARVICRVFLTDPMRRRMSRREAIDSSGGPGLAEGQDGSDHAILEIVLLEGGDFANLLEEVRLVGLEVVGEV